MKERIFVNVIDKSILGILAAFILSIIQALYDEYSVLNEKAFEITKIQTEYIAKHTGALSGAIDEFIVMGFDAIDGGKVKDEDKKEFSRLKNKIEASVFHLQALNEDLHEKGTDLSKKANSLHVEAMLKPINKHKIIEELANLRDSYSEMLKAIRETTRNIFKEEYDLSSKSKTSMITFILQRLPWIND
uniref:Uncharacterized protein n=1 Tax=Candidatus Kentrum sp. TUN TaxID=2126343 RepID=A0A450ZYB8_9GAMM|nr:MAG: hypothetical protein BECKTUN1418F_GA0071002_11542 [Candidatus Kentron sp. TUN]VFK67505.1 MAG: hypothetical protein BECKTUN1418E_GA0071001_11512 [Candidatus Kentron sp. TUN]